MWLTLFLSSYPARPLLKHNHFSCRLTDLGSITPSFDITALKKKSSSVPGGDFIYPIPEPYHKKTPIPQIVKDDGDNDATETPSSPLPQLAAGDNLLILNNPPEHIKCNTPDMDRKNVLQSIKQTVKIKSKDLINLVYTPHEDSLDEPDDACKNGEPDKANNVELDGVAKFWYGKDYVNFIVKDFNNLDAPYDDFINRVTTPRMPWHDVGVCVQGASARDVARHFIQRWNATKLEKARSNDVYPYLLPKCYDEYSTLPIMFPNEVHKVTCQVGLFYGCCG